MPGAEAAARRARHAWAKVNLYLEVARRRADGYHDLNSLVVFAGVADRVEVRAAEGLTLELAGPGAAQVPPGEDNLVLRAARALADELGVAPAAHIRLEKHLPVAAGLGGGSADAAAVLQALAELWGRRPAPDVLLRLAAALGADLPVCLFGRPAVVQGLGDVIERAPPLPPAWLVLVNPGVPLATGAVFAAYSGAEREPAPWDTVALDLPGLAEALAARSNDLEAPACALAPEVRLVLDRLAAAPGVQLARMSGSGPTCFGLFATAREARAAAGAIKADHDAWWVAAAPMLHGRLLDHWRG